MRDWTSLTSSMGHLLLLSALALSTPAALAFCPKGCQCDDMRLRVECSNSTLGEGGGGAGNLTCQTLFRRSAHRSQHED